MKAIFIVGIGGFIGCILRYLISLFIQNKYISAFPYGTLGVNIIGASVFLGILATFLGISIFSKF